MKKATTQRRLQWINKQGALSDRDRAAVKAARMTAFIDFLDAVREAPGWTKVVSLCPSAKVTARTLRRHAYVLEAAGYARLKYAQDDERGVPSLYIYSTK